MTIYTDRLREVADLLDEHTDLLPPIVVPGGQVAWHIYSWEHDDPRVVVANIRRTIGGTWEKGVAYDGKMRLSREHYVIHVEREAVCERRVVGTETVTLPAVEAQPERTVEREVVEWDCQPILGEDSA